MREVETGEEMGDVRREVDLKSPARRDQDGVRMEA